VVSGKSLVLLRDEQSVMTTPAFEGAGVKVRAPLDAASEVADERPMARRA
jgi:hypothetical protein